MERIQMTQIGIDNYMLYTSGDETKLCKICQTYPNSKFVDIACIDEDYKCIEKVDYSIKLKPIEVCDSIIKELGFSLDIRNNYPQSFGHPDNHVYDLVYKDKLSKMVVLINDLYYILLHDSITLSKKDFPLCVHHLQNLRTSVGENSFEDEASLISLLRNKLMTSPY